MCKGFIHDDRASQDSEGRIEGSKLYKSPQLLLQSESRVQFEDATDPNCLKSNQSRIRRSFAEILAAFHFNPPLIFIDVVLSVVGEHCSSNLCLLSIEDFPWVSGFNQCPLCWKWRPFTAFSVTQRWNSYTDKWVLLSFSDVYWKLGRSAALIPQKDFQQTWNLSFIQS